MLLQMSQLPGRKHDAIGYITHFLNRKKPDKANASAVKLRRSSMTGGIDKSALRIQIVVE